MLLPALSDFSGRKGRSECAANHEERKRGAHDGPLRRRRETDNPRGEFQIRWKLSSWDTTAGTLSMRAIKSLRRRSVSRCRRRLRAACALQGPPQRPMESSHSRLALKQALQTSSPVRPCTSSANESSSRSRACRNSGFCPQNLSCARVADFISSDPHLMGLPTPTVLHWRARSSL